MNVLKPFLRARLWLVAGCAFSLHPLIGRAAEVVWQKMPLLSPAAAAAGITPGGEGAQWPRGPVVVSAANPDFLLLPIDVGGVYRSLDGGREWNLAMAGWNARGANGFAIDPKNAAHVIGIGGNSMDWNPAWSTNSPNGLYRSDDQATHWQQVLSVMPAIGGAVAFDPASYDAAKRICTRVYYAAYALGLYRSEDGGTHWEVVSQQPMGMAQADFNTTLLAVSARTGHVWLGGKTGLWLSRDQGVTFQRVSDGQPVYGLSLLEGTSDTIYTSGKAGIQRTVDEGKTWEPLAAQGVARQPSEPIRNLAVSPVDPQRMLCWVQGANWQWVRYISQDGGAHFAPIQFQVSPGEILPRNGRNGYFTWHPTNPVVAYGLGGDWVTRSTDGGRTFTWWNNGYNGIMVGASFNFSATATHVVFMGFQDYNGAFTTDGGRTWNYRDISGRGWGGHAYGAFAVDAQVMWYGDAEGWGSPRKTRISRDGGQTWAFAHDLGGQECQWAGADVSCADPHDPNILFASQWRSADKGQTWNTMKDCDGVYLAMADGRLLGRKAQTLVISTNGGLGWQTICEVPGGFTDVAYDPQRGRYYFASDNRLKQFQNGAFTTLETPRDQYGSISIVTVAVDPVAPENVYAGGPKNIYASSATVVASRDAGGTWANLTRGDGPQEVSWMRVQPHTRELWLNGQCYGNWRLPAPVK